MFSVCFFIINQSDCVKWLVTSVGLLPVLQKINGNRLPIQAGMLLILFFYYLLIVINLRVETSFEVIIDYDFI